MFGGKKKNSYPLIEGNEFFVATPLLRCWEIVETAVHEISSRSSIPNECDALIVLTLVVVRATRGELNNAQ